MRHLAFYLLPILHVTLSPQITLMLMVITSVATSVTSNVATASIFIPVAGSLAQSTGAHPLSFMVCALQ